MTAALWRILNDNTGRETCTHFNFLPIIAILRQEKNLKKQEKNSDQKNYSALCGSLGSGCDVWPASPAPASSAASPSALPAPRPHVASRSSARPAARTAYSSWGRPSSDQRCVPCDAGQRHYAPSHFHYLLKRVHCPFHWHWTRLRSRQQTF